MTRATRRHLEVARTARYWVLGEEVAAPREVWFVLHGYRQLAERFVRRFPPLLDGSRWVVAPEGLSRFYVDEAPGRHGPGSVVGATWMTREDREHEIRDYVAYLDRLADTLLSPLGGAPPRVVVLGFSQGVATACRWTVLGHRPPAHRLILWGDFLPPDLPWALARERWADVDVVAARGDADPIFREGALAAAEGERLAGEGLAVRLVSYPGGHDIHQPTLQSLAASET